MSSLQKFPLLWAWESRVYSQQHAEISYWFILYWRLWLGYFRAGKTGSDYKPKLRNTLDFWIGKNLLLCGWGLSSNIKFQSCAVRLVMNMNWIDENSSFLLFLLLNMPDKLWSIYGAGRLRFYWGSERQGTSLTTIHNYGHFRHIN